MAEFSKWDRKVQKSTPRDKFVLHSTSEMCYTFCFPLSYAFQKPDEAIKNFKRDEKEFGGCRL